MAETKIEWCDYTFNPWWGCTRVSPACDHCYAASLSTRVGFPGLWDSVKRRTFGEVHWNKPMIWNERAAKVDKRFRVFCASMADVFDKDAPAGERDRLWRLIKATPHLDWLILTKRIGNTKTMLPADWGATGYDNVWLGISVVTNEEAKRDIPKLLATAANVRFLSCEPLLEPLDLLPYLWVGGAVSLRRPVGYIDWVIVGGESGAGARTMDWKWAQHIHEVCLVAGVPFFMKQGSQADSKGFKDFASFPADLQVREWP